MINEKRSMIKKSPASYRFEKIWVLLRLPLQNAFYFF
jgi:hypothetical protein